MLTSSEIRKFRATVYRYFLRHGRALPWRDTRDPYRILVSEVMLQQTQVSRVVEKYPPFIRRFPTVRSLAKARLRDILGQWQGLGYNRRAVLLHQLARKVVDEFGGMIPPRREALRTLPGIGDATAGSISAFAFDQPEVFIETNIRSVYLHHFFKDTSRVHDRQLLPYIEKTLDRKHPGRWYSALMDYGVHLKASLPNPSRRSRHHVRQSVFEGSDRQIRGRVVRLLLERSMPLAALERSIAATPERVRKAVAELVEENIVTRCPGMLAIR